jgi:hypothetical protein
MQLAFADRQGGGKTDDYPDSDYYPSEDYRDPDR